MNDHPVWEVYDLQRTCKLNQHYWTRKLVRRRSVNFWLEYAIAVTAPGSALVGFVFWKTQTGQILWTCLSVLTALLGIAKPLLKLSDHIEQLQKVVTGYRSVNFQLEELCADIRRQNSYVPEMVEAYKRLQKQVQEVTRDEPVETVDEKLRTECYETVNRELPQGSFCIPPAPPKIDPPEPWKKA